MLQVSLAAGLLLVSAHAAFAAADLAGSAGAARTENGLLFASAEPVPAGSLPGGARVLLVSWHPARGSHRHGAHGRSRSAAAAAPVEVTTDTLVQAPLAAPVAPPLAAVAAVTVPPPPARSPPAGTSATIAKVPVKPVQATPAASRQTTLRAGELLHRFGALLVWGLGLALALGIVLARRSGRQGPVETEPPASVPVELPEAVPPARDVADRLMVGPVEAIAGHMAPPLARTPSGRVEAVVNPGAYKMSCVARLRSAGWDARTRFSAGLPGPDVVASSSQGVVLALRCHPSTEPVDVAAVEDARQARDCQHSDLAAIVSNGPFTEPARQLAARTGVVLLHEDQLESFAV